MTDTLGNTLILDQNARIINNQIYVPNSSAIIKDNAAYLPAPTAYKEEATGNYFLPNEADPTSPTLIDDVIVNMQGKIWAKAAQFDLQLSNDGTLVPYTPDPTAQMDSQQRIFTTTGTQPLPKVSVVQGKTPTELAQSDAAPDTAAGGDAKPAAAPAAAGAEAKPAAAAGADAKPAAAGADAKPAAAAGADAKPAAAADAKPAAAGGADAAKPAEAKPAAAAGADAAKPADAKAGGAAAAKADPAAAKAAEAKATAAAVAAAGPAPEPISKGSIVLRGQWVQDSGGKDLIIIDPTDQSYEVLYADKDTSSIRTFEKDPLP